MSAWDDGLRWHLERTDAPDMSYDALVLAEIRDQHLKAGNGQDDWIYRAWLVTYRRAEMVTRRPLIPQTWQLVMSRFPYGSRPIVVPKSPLLAVASIAYVDDEGATQTLTGSPADFTVIAPNGPNPKRGEIYPLYDETWPSVRLVPDAVTVTFTCGYPLTVTSPQVASVPEDITHGRLLMLGELYKQRSLSVHAFNQNPAIVQAEAIWKEYRVF